MIYTQDNTERTVPKTCKLLCYQEVYNADENSARWVGARAKLLYILFCESADFERLKKDLLIGIPSHEGRMHKEQVMAI
jgi:hypothetical protein